MEKFAGYFFAYMAGVATPFVILVILWAEKGEYLTLREFLSGGKNG